MDARQNPAELLSALYLTILSRYPTEEELRTMDAYAESGVVSKRAAAVDLAWFS